MVGIQSVRNTKFLRTTKLRVVTHPRTSGSGRCLLSSRRVIDSATEPRRATISSYYIRFYRYLLLLLYYDYRTAIYSVQN